MTDFEALLDYNKLKSIIKSTDHLITEKRTNSYRQWVFLRLDAGQREGIITADQRIDCQRFYDGFGLEERELIIREIINERSI